MLRGRGNRARALQPLAVLTQVKTVKAVFTCSVLIVKYVYCFTWWKHCSKLAITPACADCIADRIQSQLRGVPPGQLLVLLKLFACEESYTTGAMHRKPHPGAYSTAASCSQCLLATFALNRLDKALQPIYCQKNTLQ